MRDYTLTHLSDAALLRDLAALVARDRLTTATLLAHIAEVDARRLYVPAGYPSMHAYCVDELRLSEDAASKRIQAARAARRFPALFTALAEGRLHLAAVCLLAPHLAPGNADMLIEAATHRRKSEIEEWLARRFSPPESPTRMRAIPAILSPSTAQHAPGHVEPGLSALPRPLDEHAPGHVGSTQVQAPPDDSERFILQLTIARSTRDKLQHALALLSHSVPSGDVAQVLDRALDALIRQLERRKLGALTRPPHRSGAADAAAPVRGGPSFCPRSTAGRHLAAGSRPTPGSRYVPASVRRGVWERDKGQCTYVSASGIRCKSRRFLEFDHVHPVARGGRATVDSMRLRCRAHNQYEAERTFGAAFMKRKRLQARLAAAEARAAVPEAEALVPAGHQSQDVLASLLGLGCKAGEGRTPAGAFPDATELDEAES